MERSKESRKKSRRRIRLIRAEHSSNEIPDPWKESITHSIVVRMREVEAGVFIRLQMHVHTLYV